MISRVVVTLVALLSLTAAVHDAAAQPARPARNAPAPAPLPSPPSDIRVRSSLSQSAAWVGDPVEYLVEIDAAPGIDVVTADLGPDKLVVEGLEIGGTGSAVETRADGWRTFSARFRVTAWDAAPAKTIAPIVVRFRRPVTSASADGTAAAGELTVPGARLTMRSTLPDDGSASGTRDRGAELVAPAWIAWLRPVGIGLIALGIAPVVLWLSARAVRPRVSRHRVSSRSLNQQLSAMFKELQIIDTGSADGRRRAYDRLDADLRAYVSQAESVPASALSADELRPRLAASSRVPVDAICDALAQCEVARYAPESRLPAVEALGATIARLQSAFGR